jgi:CubicO group peptidase (beta-lactamase class C family)
LPEKNLQCTDATPTTREPSQNQSVFEFASISKQFTTSILLLAEQGKLTLSDTLRKFFPHLTYHGITLHEFLLHTSGLPDYQQAFDQRWDHQKVAINQDQIAFLAREKLPLDFKPGARWQYANAGCELLASIVGQVSGQSFGDYLKQAFASTVSSRWPSEKLIATMINL